MRLKTGVRLGSLQPQLIVAMIACNDVFAEHDKSFTITSVNDSVHGQGSLHFGGAAFDVRTRHLAQGVAQIITIELRGRLGDDFDVVLEEDHIHIEYQPKREGG